MIIGIPKETQAGEKRVMLLPEEVKELIQLGHIVWVEEDAAIGIRICDKDYEDVGAISVSERQVYQADLIVRLKRPEGHTFDLLKSGSTLFCMGHSEDEPDLVEELGKRNVLLVEMEKLYDKIGERIINQCSLTGEIAIYNSLQYFEKLPTDMKTIIIGQGNVSQGALKACNKLGIDVTMIRRPYLDKLPEFLEDADMLVNGIPWTPEEKKNPKYILTQNQLQLYANPHLLILDLICAEPPNPIETLRPTFYNDPFYEVDGRKHISLWGYPGLVPISSAKIYSKQVIPFVKMLAQNSSFDWRFKHPVLSSAIKPYVHLRATKFYH